MRPFKFFRSNGFPYVQPIKMQCSQAVHCNWLKIRKVTAPESQKTLRLIKLIYSEKATKICEVFPLLLSTVHTVKSKEPNFVAFSEYMNVYKNKKLPSSKSNKFVGVIGLEVELSVGS